jgi:ParB family transcriptional regulator, chromosome partitioning protein
VTPGVPSACLVTNCNQRKPTMATKKQVKKPTKPRRKKVEAQSKGLKVSEVEKPVDVAQLKTQIQQDGGTIIGAYHEPIGGHLMILAALPIDKVEPTPYQRDPSEAHVKKLADAMEKVNRFVDPIVTVRNESGMYWTPNGNHRLRAMKLIGQKSIIALVIPDEKVAFQILALNTEKAHNLKEKSLEVIRMYRGLVGAQGDKPETEFISYFEEAHFITLGAAYELRPRFSAGAYSSVVKRLEGFQEDSLIESLVTRESRAKLLLEFDDAVVSVVEALKAKGLDSPYLKNFVVAKVNFLRFKKGGEFDFEDTLNQLILSVKKIDSGKINKEDVGKMGGAPGESDE